MPVQLLPVLTNSFHERKIGAVTQASELLQGVLSMGRQTAELVEHEVDYIVGITLDTNASQVPQPPPRTVIEREQSILGERGKKLDHEEGIAGSPLEYQLRERLTALVVAAERIRDQVFHVLAG